MTSYMDQLFRFFPVLIAVGVFIGLGLMFIWMNKVEKRKAAGGRSNDRICDHDWQPDGQTLTAVRWTCTKCQKTQLNGLEI